MSTRRPQSLDEALHEIEVVKRELAEIRLIATNAEGDAGRANERIDLLERRLNELSLILTELRSTVNEFGPRQERFLAQMWKLVTNLLLIIGIAFAIVAGLVGLKLAIPVFQFVNYLI